MSSEANTSSSAGLHRTAATTGVEGAAYAAFAYYNLGTLNRQVGSKNWAAALNDIAVDVQNTFESDPGIQVLMLSEFGNMADCIDKELRKHQNTTTQKLFQDLVQQCGL